MSSLESLHRGVSNEYTSHIIVFFLFIEDKKDTPKLSSFASWIGLMTNTQ